MTFCKTCGTLSPRGCPKGHDSALNDKIKDVIQAEDGTRVLISDYNLGKDDRFLTYTCQDHYMSIYVLKIPNKEPADFLRISFDSNPCSKGRKYGTEAYNLQDITIPKIPVKENKAERNLKEAETNLEKWVDRYPKNWA